MRLLLLALIAVATIALAVHITTSVCKATEHGPRMGVPLWSRDARNVLCAPGGQPRPWVGHPAWMSGKERPRAPVRGKSGDETRLPLARKRVANVPRTRSERLPRSIIIDGPFNSEVQRAC
jgi:hypothetical protein